MSLFTRTTTRSTQGLTARAGALIAATLAALSFVAGPATADLVYTFDSSDQGWSTINDTSFFGFDGSIGNPPGAIRAIDQAAGFHWCFSAPVADLGDLSSLFGRNISYQILGITGAHNTFTTRAAVIITGAGLRIGVASPITPAAGQWVSWNLPVNADGAWRIVASMTEASLSSTVATEQQIRDVLANVDGLFIRGEYTNGADSSALDNVRIETGGCNDADFADPVGVLDFFDVLAFLQAYSGSDPSADLNDDGVFDFFDVLAFLEAFSAGCP